MALGNDLDSKIVEIYQEYLKNQKDEKIANRVYASEESFRNGLEEVIKLNGIVDKSEFYTAIAFEIQNGNFSISSDGKIDITSESITKAVERAKQAENKKIKINDTNENEIKNILIEKGILGITEIKTREDAQRVLSAKIKASEMTPEKKKLTKDAMAFTLSEVMDETAAAEIADEIVEVTTAPADVPPETVETMVPPTIEIIDKELITAVANSSLIPNNINQDQDRIFAAIDLIVRLSDGVDPSKMKFITDEIIKFSNKCSEMKIANMPWAMFVKSGDTYHFGYMSEMTRKLFSLEQGGILNSENVQNVVNETFEQMEADGIEVTPEMRAEASKIVINPECVTKQVANNRVAKQQMLEGITRNAPEIFTTFFNQYGNSNGLTAEQKYTIEQKAMVSKYFTPQVRDGKIVTQGGIEKSSEGTIPVTESQLGIEADGSTFVDNVVNPQLAHRVGREKFDFLSYDKREKYGEYKFGDVQTSGDKGYKPQTTMTKKVAETSLDGLVDGVVSKGDNGRGATGVVVDKSILNRNEINIVEQDAAIESSASEFSIDGELDGVFAAMFGSGITEEITIGGTEVEHEPEVEGEVEVVEDAPIGAAAASGLVAEDVVFDEPAPKVNEVQAPPAINEPVAEVVEEPKAPEQPGMLAVDTLSNKIKRGLNELGKRVKGIFGKVAGLFGGGSNDSSNNTGTTGTGGIVQDTKSPKTTQAPGQDFIQHVDLKFDFLKNDSAETRTDPTKPKGVDESTQGFEVDD